MLKHSVSSIVRHQPLLAGFAIALALLFSSAGPAAAQGKATSEFFAEAFVPMVKIVDAATKNLGYGLNEGTSILGAWVKNNGRVDMELPLNAGQQYAFLATGDLDAEDVDLFILDKNGNVLAQDVRPNREAAVEFKPAVSGRYTLRLHLFKSRNNLPCVCVATVLRKGGWIAPAQNLAKAAVKLVNELSTADRELQQRLNMRVDLLSQPNQWCLYGGVLRERQTLRVWNLQLGSGLRGFLGVADDFAQALFLSLNASKGGAVKQSVGQTAAPSFAYQAGPGLHELQLTNDRATGPAVVLMAVFSVRN
jgi:hypothetical protein